MVRRTVEGLPVIVVSVIADLVMATCAFIHRDGRGGRLQHALSDARHARRWGDGSGRRGGGAIILIVGGVYWLDSAVALVIAAIIAYHALKLIGDVLAHLRPTRANTDSTNLAVSLAAR